MMTMKSEKIRARIFGQMRSYRSPRSRKTVWWTQWYMEITDGEMVINADDCRDFSNLVADAHRRVAAYRLLADQGVKFRPWRDLVAEAKI